MPTGRRSAPSDVARQIYNEMAKGRLDRHLEANPKLISAQVATALTQDFRQALEYQDLGAATTAADACVEILTRMGEARTGVGIFIDLFRAQLQLAGSVEEFMALRTRALTNGARAQDEQWPAAQVECWLIAIEAGIRMIPVAKPERSRGLLLAAFRDLADVCEYVADQRPEVVLAEHRSRLVYLLTNTAQDVYAQEWAEHSLLPVRSLLKRITAATERIVSQQRMAELLPSADESRAAGESLLRLFTEINR